MLVQAIQLRPKKCEKQKKQKKIKKIFASFPFKGCRPLRDHVKIAHL